MPITYSKQISELAEPQHGYFTAAQAKAAGFRRNAITLMARRGVIERVSRGVYRIANYPISKESAYIEAVLWPQRGVRGVLSHQSALEFYGLSDVSPSKIHITVSPGHRVRRKPPLQLALHVAILPDEDVTVINGIPVTTPVRSIRDAHAAHVRPSLIRQAIEDGRRLGTLLQRDVAPLLALIGGVNGAPPVTASDSAAETL